MATHATFATFIKNERIRLDKAHKEAVASKAVIDRELQSIEAELTALNAYRQSKATTAKRPAKRGPNRGPKRAVRRATGRKGEKRKAVLNLIQQHPDGISRGELLTKMGVKGNKSAEQSVSNALFALKKTDKVNSLEGRYVPA